MSADVSTAKSPSKNNAKEDPKAQSLTHRAWKFVSSKSLDTKLGRKLMIHSLGPDGAKVAQFVIKCGNEFYGENAASEVLKTVLKMISKTQSITQTGQFDIAESKQVREPIHDCLFEIYRVLKNSEEFFDANDQKAELEVSNADVEIVSTRLMTCLKLWETLMQPHLTAKNVQAFQVASDQLSAPNFVKSVFSDSELKNPESREVFLASLNTFVNSFQVDIGPMDQYCCNPTCGKDVLQAAGLFLGSKFCEAHHKEYTDVLFKQPRLKNFLEFKENQRYLKSYLTSLEDIDKTQLQFFNVLLAHSDFKKTVILSDRINSVKTLIQALKVYIESVPANAFDIELARKLIDEMQKLLEESRVPPINFWKLLLQEKEAPFEEAVMKDFVKSKEFLRLIISLTCPPQAAPPPLNKDQSSSLGF